MSRPTAAQLDLLHHSLLDQERAVADMPLDTREQMLARYEARVEVSLALAEVYAAKRQQVDPGTVVSHALVVAERDSRDSAERAQQLVRNVRSRIKSASKDGQR